MRTNTIRDQLACERIRNALRQLEPDTQDIPAARQRLVEALGILEAPLGAYYGEKGGSANV